MYGKVRSERFVITQSLAFVERCTAAIDGDAFATVRMAEMIPKACGIEMYLFD